MTRSAETTLTSPFGPIKVSGSVPVSYTHLDVYKRQAVSSIVSSAASVLTVVFGMGTGVSPKLSLIHI